MGHHHHNHHHHTGQKNKKNLIIAMLMIGSWMIIQFIGGLWTGSLALLADAVHMLNDFSNLLISLVAIILAAKAVTQKRTYGNHRYEVLAALFNSVALLVISVFIFREAIFRFMSPQEIIAEGMIFIAFVGLIANIGAMYALTRGDVKENLNMRGAYLHVLSDTLGSVVAILAGVIIYFTGWYMADPILSIIIAIMIAFTAFSLLKDSVHVLLEGTPENINVKEIEHALLNIKGVINIHDLHVWTITSGINSLTVHLIIDPSYSEKNHEILLQANEYIRTNLNIKHSTVQIEKEDLREHEHQTI
ncbi:cation diffusion facilitator family transporter [Evansella cellulosilytica]|uniref:Cation diffusion facilitator family transporter n=1 Tax=Evansella cellulosilytica (strain ATCC 21833 / DSM 2522 / FERM P-1141 / JCM 9156 / N-4) TaxID=649639 RepID=E6TWH0_EVAC2|nr:cation diffusion facilitator family transporter [Evansella cellulosilytica]ADU32233.1 cation diffusion facilitator family transporter [Evansella cellulosilytica DSM 2522]